MRSWVSDVPSCITNNEAYGYHIKGMVIKDMTDKLFQFTPFLNCSLHTHSCMIKYAV